MKWCVLPLIPRGETCAGGMRGCATIEIVGNSKIMGTANEIEMANQNWQRVAVAGRKMSFNEAQNDFHRNVVVSL